MAYIIIAAIALLLILEGFLPFVAPKLWRHMVMSMAGQSDKALRITGLVLMLLGVGMFILAHNYF
jgi:uncharacterized protein